jgi:hypothetical protein
MVQEIRFRGSRFRVKNLESVIPSTVNLEPRTSEPLLAFINHPGPRVPGLARHGRRPGILLPWAESTLGRWQLDRG